MLQDIIIFKHKCSISSENFILIHLLTVNQIWPNQTNPISISDHVTTCWLICGWHIITHTVWACPKRIDVDNLHYLFSVSGSTTLITAWIFFSWKYNGFTGGFIEFSFFRQDKKTKIKLLNKRLQNIRILR